MSPAILPLRFGAAFWGSLLIPVFSFRSAPVASVVRVVAPEDAFFALYKSPVMAFLFAFDPFLLCRRHALVLWGTARDIFHLVRADFPRVPGEIQFIAQGGGKGDRFFRAAVTDEFLRFRLQDFILFQ